MSNLTSNLKRSLCHYGASFFILFAIACEKNTSPSTVGKLIGAIVEQFYIEIGPTQVDFGNVTVGQPNPGQKVTVTSQADSSLYVTGITLDDSASFSLENDDENAESCLKGALAKGKACSFIVRFLPSQPGDYVGTVSVAYGHSVGAPEKTITVNLVAKAQLGETGDAVIAPTVKNFGALVEGIQTASETFKVTNNSSRALYLTDIGIDSDAFILVSNTCPAIGGTLARGQSCDITVSYEPYSGSSNEGTLLVLLGNKPGQRTFALKSALTGGVLRQSMVGQSAIASNPTSLDFDSRTLLSPSQSKQITISNTSIISTYFGRIATTTVDYSITSNNCPMTPRALKPGDTCDIYVRFNPTAEGSRAAAVALAWGLEPGDNQFTYSIELAGTGVRPVLVFNGLTSIDNVTGVSMRLNWSNITEAASYQVYQIDGSGSATFVKAVAAPATSTNVSGLTPATSYKFRVRAFSASGDSDLNTNDITQLTLPSPPPSITSVSPTSGIATGGTTISINGSGFSVGSAVVKIGLVDCVNYSVRTSTLITCDTQAQASGVYPISVTNSDTQTSTMTNAYTYAVPFNGLQGISQITGTTMTLTWGVSSAAASYQIYRVNSGVATYYATVAAPAVASTLTGLTPNTSYTWRVRAFDSNNGSDANTTDVTASTLANPPPALTSVSPTTSVLAGGSTLTITGTSFASGATVSIGGSTCGSINVVSATQITCTLPAHSAGAKNVTVTNSDTQAATLNSAVTYKVSFNGLQSITSTTGISMNLSWSASPDAASYHIYRMVSGSPVFVSSVPSSSLSYTATALTPNTSYTWRVRAFDLTGAQDDNTADLSQNTLQHYPPTITAVSPASVSKSLGGSQQVTITGTDFRAGALVTVGGFACNSVTIVSSTSLTCTPAPLAVGSYTAAITNSDDAQSGSLASAFSYIVQFGGLSSINQVKGNAMTLNWSGSPDASSFYIYQINGGTPSFIASVASNVTSYTPTGLTPGQSYIWRVRAVDNLGAQDTNTTNLPQATLANMPPNLTSVSPPRGALAGGGTLTLTGTDFRTGASITVGGTTCGSVSVSTATTATCSLPAKTAGTYDVTITNDDTQYSTVSNAYIYQPAPTVTSISPNSGTYLGGQTITITGTGFVSGATVTVNGTTCTSPTVNSATAMTCVTPAHSTGTIRTFVNVRVTNSDNQYGQITNGYLYTVDNLTFLAGQPNTLGCSDGDGVAQNARFSGVITGLYNDGTFLYMSDSAGGMIRRMNLSTGALSLVAGKRCVIGDADGLFGSATIRAPYGLVKIEDALYFADNTRHIIRKVDLSAGNFGTVTTVAGTYASAGNLNGAGLAAKFNAPRGLATDGTYIYVADMGNHNIRRVDPKNSFTVTTIAGTTAATPVAGSADGLGTAATLNSPRDIAYYEDAPRSTAYLLVTTLSDHRIRAIRLSDNNVTTIAGTTAGYIDANNITARFNQPHGITINGTNAYIADYNTHTIRKIDLSDFSTFAVTTIAGINARADWQDGALGTNRTHYPLFISAHGTNIYFADSSATLRKVDLSTGSNTVSTVLGYNPQVRTGQILQGHNTSARLIKHFYGKVTTDGSNIYFANYTSGYCIQKLNPNLAYQPQSLTIPIASPATMTLNNHGYVNGDIVTINTTLTLPTGFTAGTQYYVKNATTNTFQLSTTPGGTSINAVGSQAGSHIIYKPNVTIVSGICGTAGGTDGPSIGTPRHNGSAGLVYSPDLNSLLVAEYSGHVIRRIDLTSGTTTTIAGTYGTLGASDHALGTSALLNGPMSLAIDTSVTPNELYVGEWNAGNHIRKIVLDGTNYPVSTIVGTAGGVAGAATNTDGFGTAATTYGVHEMAIGTYTVGGTTYRKLFFTPYTGYPIRSYDLDTTFVQTLTSATTGYQDTDIPAASLSDTQNAKFGSIKGMYWNGNHLVLADYGNSVMRWFEPQTGTVGTLMEGYTNLSKFYTTAGTPYFESINSGTISGGTASITQPSGITYLNNLGYIIANTSGIWILN